MSAGSRRKRQRKEALRRRQRRAHRLSRAAAVCLCLVATGMVGLVLVLVLTEQHPAAWLAGPTGLLALVAAGLLTLRERVDPRKGTTLGRLGVVCVGVLGLALAAAQVLALARFDDAAHLLVTLAFVPALLAVKCLGLDQLRGGPEGSGPSVSSMMSDITEFHT